MIDRKFTAFYGNYRNVIANLMCDYVRFDKAGDQVGKKMADDAINALYAVFGEIDFSEGFK